MKGMREEQKKQAAAWCTVSHSVTRRGDTQVDMNDEAKVHSHLQVCLCVRWLLVVSPGPQPQARTYRQQSVLTS